MAKILISILLFCSVDLDDALCPDIIPYGYTPDIYANIWHRLLGVESDYIHVKNGQMVKSHKSAYGISQITKETIHFYNLKNGTKYQVKDVIDIKINLKIGRWFFDYCMDKKKSTLRAVSAYNMGVNTPWVNTNYASKVLGVDFVKNGLSGCIIWSNEGPFIRYYHDN